MDIKDLSKVLEGIHTQLLQHASRAINLSLTLRNWLFGYFIQEYEQNGSDRAKYGERVIHNLAEVLEKAHVPAASVRHLRLCRQFYQSYPQIQQTVFAKLEKIYKNNHLKSVMPIRQTAFAELNDNQTPSLPPEKLVNTLSYSHFLELMKIEKSLKRSFYELECVSGHWAVRELKRQIASLYYERSGLSKDKNKLASLIKAGTQANHPKDIIRDPYVFEFLELKSQEIVLESNLANALLDKLQKFLIELGKGFCFEARNKKILIGDEYFFIDLVFYHRILKCSVLVELKTSAFNHHYLGQLNTYVNYYKKHEMHAQDNPPIGILLCTEKNHALVEYALGDTNNQIFVSRYKLELPSEEDMKIFLEQSLKEQAEFSE